MISLNLSIDQMEKMFLHVLEQVDFDISSLTETDPVEIGEICLREAKAYKRNKIQENRSKSGLTSIREEAESKISDEDVALIEAITKNDNKTEHNPVEEEDGSWPIIFTYNKEAY